MTCVGIATLAAFIGAGGLGQFINRGLALADTRLILLGAIPAAILALLVDQVVAAAQWALEPHRRRGKRRKGAAALRAVALVAPLVLIAGGAVGYVRTRPDLVIGSKNFTEQILLSHMLADLIEARTDLTVDRRLCLGGTMICHEALRDGEIDLYVEYTGTGLMAVLGRKMDPDPDAVYRIVSSEYSKRFDMEWLPPLGFNNTYAFCVRRDDARRHGWQTISDLKPDAERLRIGFPAEFHERPDGYRGFTKAYGFAFGSTSEIDTGIMYDVIAAGEVDVITAFSTDGRIAAFNLQPLVDDRRFFPPYYAAPVVRARTLQRCAELREILALLAGRLDDATMRRLNFQVDDHQGSPDQVAREYLRSQGLIP